MLLSEDITDYIHKILIERKTVSDVTKPAVINFHCSENDAYPTGEIRARVHAISEISDEFEIEGPIYVSQTCFLSKKPHNHIKFTIKGVNSF